MILRAFLHQSLEKSHGRTRVVPSLPLNLVQDVPDTRLS